VTREVDRDFIISQIENLIENNLEGKGWDIQVGTTIYGKKKTTITIYLKKEYEKGGEE